MEGAQAYVREGPPYFGKSDFKDLKAIKQAGGRWSGEKKLWKAPDASALKALIETGVWEPDGAEGRLVLVAIRMQQNADEAKREAMYKAAALKKAAPVLTEAQMEAKQRKDCGVSEDTPEQLARLWDQFQITQSMLKPAFHWSNLGPRGGLSDACRVLRGLKFNVVTKEEMWSGIQVESEMDKRRKQREAEKVSAKSSAKASVKAAIKKGANASKDVAPSSMRPKTTIASAPVKECNPYSRDALKRHWESQEEDCGAGHSYKCHKTHANDDDNVECMQVLSYPQVDIKWVKDTKCAVCKRAVSDQFLDCYCEEAIWQRCTTCMRKYRTDTGCKHNTACGCS